MSKGDSETVRVRVRAWQPGRIGVIEVDKVWGRVIGPGWRLRRGPGPRGSVLERKPAQGVRVRHANGGRTPTRKKIGACVWRVHTDTKEN